MPKTKISEYSTTNSDNTDIENINIAEGCAPSGINNAIRELMVHLKEFQTGASGDAFTFAGGTLMSGTNTISGAAIISGNINSSGTNTFSGSNVMSFSGGSSASPSIYFASDTNTGIFSPAADTIAFTEGGAESMRIDSSGNLGLGVTPTNNTLGKTLQNGQAGAWTAESGTNRWWLGSNWYFNSGDKYINNGFATLYSQQNGTHTFFTAASGTANNAITFTQAMTLDVNGSLAVGGTTVVTNDGGITATTTSSGSVQATLAMRNAGTGNGTGTTLVFRGVSNTSAEHDYGYLSMVADDTTAKTGSIRFSTTAGSSPVERARITSGGDLLVGTTSASGNGERLNVTGSSTSYLGFFDNTSTGNRRGIISTYSGSSPPNDTGNEFLYCNDNSAQRMSVRSNGGIANYSANDANLSDRREKTNFAPATAYLDKICAIPVQTFNYIDQNLEQDDGLTLGVVAQDVQLVAPELVTESNWGTEEEPKMRLSIYQTDLQYALMKCIQEQQAIITQLQADVAALKGTA